MLLVSALLYSWLLVWCFVSNREVVKAQVLAFEKLRLQDNLDAIANIDVEKNVAEFRELMITVEDLEASLHRDIISQRLAVIKKLDEDQQNRVKEVIVQEHIYNHLWLVDSKWEYKENPTYWELRVTAHLKTACPDIPSVLNYFALLVLLGLK